MKTLFISVLFIICVQCSFAQVENSHRVKAFYFLDDTTRLFHSEISSIRIKVDEDLILIDKVGTLNDGRSAISKKIRSTAYISGKRFECYRHKKEEIYIGSEEIYLVQHEQDMPIWYHLNKDSLIEAIPTSIW